MFDGPQRAIRCAMSIRDAVQALGIEVRAGLHTGECEVRGDDIGGIAVHIGARVSALAGPNDVLVSSTLRDFVIGSGLEFEERGAHTLKGVPGDGGFRRRLSIAGRVQNGGGLLRWVTRGLLSLRSAAIALAAVWVRVWRRLGIIPSTPRSPVGWDSWVANRRSTSVAVGWHSCGEEVLPARIGGVGVAGAGGGPDDRAVGKLSVAPAA